MGFQPSQQRIGLAGPATLSRIGKGCFRYTRLVPLIANPLCPKIEGLDGDYWRTGYVEPIEAVPMPAHAYCPDCLWRNLRYLDDIADDAAHRRPQVVGIKL